MTNKRRLAVSLFLILFVFVFSGCGNSAASSYKIDLEIWGLFDDATAYNEIINKYKEINPYAGTIKYRKFTPDTYRQELMEALASGQGPDIFLINNTWFPAFENKLASAPTIITNEKEVRDNFVDVVYDDFTRDGKIYGLPLSVDSIALYYNKDLFNAVGISAPPKTWTEFNDAVKKITKINSVGDITQSAAAIGTSKNVNRASDILSVLMMQNGVEMPTVKTPQANFDQSSLAPDGQTVSAGVDALDYYTQFSRLTINGASQNPLATWNSRMHYSVDAFTEGSTAMMFNYSYQLQTIKNQNQKLNFATAPLPQAYPSKPVNYANYEAFVVSKNKTDSKTSAPISEAKNNARIHEAWQFLKFLTMKNNNSIHLINAVSKSSKDFPINFDPAVEYLKKTERPAARRDVLEAQKTDDVISAFATGNLIAKSWYQADSNGSQQALLDAIDSVVRGDSTIQEALKVASNRVNTANRGY